MTPANSLITERLKLRKPKGSDLDAYVTYCTSERIKFAGGPFNPSDAFEKLATMIGHWDIRGFGRYVIELDGRPIGHVGPLAIDDADKPELTWSLWEDAVEGHGYASEASLACAKHLLQYCGWTCLLILILPDNVRSIRVAERMGARILAGAEAPGWYPEAVTYHLTAEMLG